MTVYLDNNIFVDIEEGNYSLNDFLNIKNAEYYYSDAHINELLNGLDKSIPKLKETRLETINKICGRNYLFQDTASDIKYALCSPEQAFDNAIFPESLRGRINELARRFTPNRAGVLKELGWDSKVIGNYGPEEIFNAIEEKLLASNYHYSIIDYLFLSEAFSESTRYITLFNLLDSVNYRKDKDNVARLYDSSHAYYGHMCGILVSNDARMRIKTEAVYHYLNVATRVMSADDYLEGL